MKLVTIKSEGLAHNSYFLSDGAEAVVIDPRRDCQVYTRIADKECTKILYILETHRNEDYVVGSLELQNMTDAEIAHSNVLPFKYGEHGLRDGDILNIGNLRVKVLHTPGHTDESVCYVIYNSANPQDATNVFTGDTLFVGSVGRTDLYGREAQPEQAKKLHTSITEKLLSLGDHVIIHPGHGAGSICGGNISPMDTSTLGYEKKTNPYLQLDQAEFIAHASAEEMIVPRYFKKMEEYNLNGSPSLRELALPRPMNVTDFERHIEEPNMLIVDTRMPYAFAGSHIPSSLSLWLGGTSVYPGWLIPTEQYVIFVTERPDDVKKAATRFRRVGFHNLYGYLCPGISKWQEAGKPIASIGTLSVEKLRAKLMNNEITLLDVREPSEWKHGHAEGARYVFFADLFEQTSFLPKDKPVAVICSVGNRSSIGASILKQKGFKEVYNVLGGMTAWETLGYPLKKE